jgi:hypothetical protein
VLLKAVTLKIDQIVVQTSSAVVASSSSSSVSTVDRNQLLYHLERLDSGLFRSGNALFQQAQKRTWVFHWNTKYFDTKKAVVREKERKRERKGERKGEKERKRKRKRKREEKENIFIICFFFD